MQIAQTPFITRSQLEAKFAQVKNLKSMSTQSKPPLGNKPGSQRASSAELDRLKAENASLRAKLVTGKPAPAKPAAPSASILETFHAMTGPAAAAFYAAHGPAIRAELANRNHDRAVIENEMKAARAAGKNLAELKKR